MTLLVLVSLRVLILGDFLSPYLFLQTFILWFEPGGVVWRIASDQVTYIFLLIGLKHEAPLLTHDLVLELDRHVIIVGVHGDGLDLGVHEGVHHHLVFGPHELKAIHVDGQDDITGVGPHAFVVDLEQGAAVERKLLDTGQVPHHGLQLSFPLTVMLQEHSYIDI